MNKTEQHIRAANDQLKADIDAVKESMKTGFFGKVDGATAKRFLKIIEVEVAGRKVRVLQGLATAGLRAIKNHQARIEAQAERGKRFAQKVMTP